MNNFRYDVICVLGGGRNEEGLTDLSKECQAYAGVKEAR